MKKTGFDWDHNEDVRRELGLDRIVVEDTEEIPFTGPAWTEEVWGDYFRKLDREFEEGEF